MENELCHVSVLVTAWQTDREPHYAIATIKETDCSELKVGSTVRVLFDRRIILGRPFRAVARRKGRFWNIQCAAPSPAELGTTRVEIHKLLKGGDHLCSFEAQGLALTAVLPREVLWAIGLSRVQKGVPLDAQLVEGGNNKASFYKAVSLKDPQARRLFEDHAGTPHLAQFQSSATSASASVWLDVWESMGMYAVSALLNRRQLRLAGITNFAAPQSEMMGLDEMKSRLSYLCSQIGGDDGPAVDIVEVTFEWQKSDLRPKIITIGKPTGDRFPASKSVADWVDTRIYFPTPEEKADAQYADEVWFEYSDRNLGCGIAIGRYSQLTAPPNVLTQGARAAVALKKGRNGFTVKCIHRISM